jgi:hypothetical protein
MKRGVPYIVYVVSAVLLVYIVLISLGAPLKITGLLFFLSPFLVVWMVIAVLKSKTFTGKDLEDGEEWGYADKRKEDLGTF